MHRLGRGAFATLVLLLAAFRLFADPAGGLERGFAGWREVRTAHFVFIYEPRDAAAVRQLLSFAERVYGELTELLGSHPPRVWVVVAGRVDLANGFTTAFPPHITLYLAPPSEPLIGLDASQYLRLLLVHELTHFINFEYDRGFFNLLSKLFGPVVKDANAAFLPTWFLEGIATDTETLFTNGGRGRNPFFTMEYRAFLYAHRFFTLSTAAYASDFPPADRDWIGGYLFFHYLIDHYGRGVYRRIYRDFAAFPLLGPGGAIKRATGRSAGALYAAMVRELEASYDRHSAVPAGRRVVPAEIGNWFLPVVTARGWYLYRSTLGRPPAIVDYDPASRRERVLLRTPLTDSSSLTASADGRRIVFATTEVTEGRSGEIVASDLFRLDPRTGAVRRITTGAHAWQPRLTPDGTRLFAVSALGPCSRLVEIDQRDGSMRLLFSERDSTVSTPAISPNGSMIAFEVETDGRKTIRLLSLRSPERPISPDDPIGDFNVGRARIVVPAATEAAAGGGASVGAAGGGSPAGATVAGAAGGGAYYPSFLGNTRLLFAADHEGTVALYETDLDGRGRRLVCDDPVGAWAGERVGDELLYATDRTTGYTLRAKSLGQAAGPECTRGVERVTDTERATGMELSADAQTPPFAPVDAHRAGSPPGIPGSRRYLDLPRFLGWTPFPLYFSSIATPQIVAAPSALFWGLSNLGRSSFFASLSLRTDVLQPAAQLALNGTIGTVGVGYSLSEGYTDLSPTDHREELSQQLGLSIPLVASQLLSTATSLTLSASVADLLSEESPQPFSFAQGFGSGIARPSLSHQLDATLGARFERLEAGSAFELFARQETFASAALSLYPPIVSSTGAGAVASAVFSQSIPSPIPHQAIMLGIKTSYVSFGLPFYQITTARGAFDPTVQYLPGRTLLALDYQIPIALLDQPLFYSLGLIGIGMAFHVEAAADWSTAPLAVVADRELYAGAEVDLKVAVGEQSFPVGIGVSVRFSRDFTTPLDWATDVRPYLSLSTDSFNGTLFGAAPSPLNLAR